MVNILLLLPGYLSFPQMPGNHCSCCRDKDAGSTGHIPTGVRHRDGDGMDGQCRFWIATSLGSDWQATVQGLAATIEKTGIQANDAEATIDRIETRRTECSQLIIFPAFSTTFAGCIPELILLAIQYVTQAVYCIARGQTGTKCGNRNVLEDSGSFWNMSRCVTGRIYCNTSGSSTQLSA